MVIARFKKSRWNAVAIFVALFLEVFLLQFAGDAFSSGYGGHPDEAAHLVSSVMVHDFLADFTGLRPMEFANNFYIHYPKVAIGNWPPLLYIMLALWFFVFGATRATALTFIAVVAAGTGTLIYLTGRRLISAPAGVFAAVLYLAIPLVQESSAKVMTEHLVTFLIFASTVLLSRFFQNRTVSNALLFGFAASAAILTRGSAWALVLIVPLVIVLTRDWKSLRDWRLWLSAVPVMVFCVPWYVATKGMSRGAMVGTDPNAPYAFFIEASARFPIIAVQSTGLLLACLAALGLWRTIVKPATPHFLEWSAQAALIFGVLMIHCLVPAAIESRYMVQLLPAVLLFATAGTAFLISTVPNRYLRYGFGMPLAWAGFAGIAAWSTFEVPDYIQNRGYDQIASRLTHDLKAESKIAVLIASDSIGEGSLVAAIAMHEKRPKTLVLRGSKILASEDWLGRDSQERFPTADAMSSVLESVPVTAIVIDHGIDKHLERPYHKLLKAVLSADIEHWRLDHTFNIVRNGKTKPDAVSLYIRTSITGQEKMKEVDSKLVSRLMQRDWQSFAKESSF